MQLIELSLDHWNFYCPVTGKKITSEGSELSITPSLKGFWIEEVIDKPDIPDHKLATAWDKFLNSQTGTEDIDADLVNKFLESYSSPTWAAFCIHSGTPFFNATCWYVIDMNDCCQQP